jgi:hypothetical protein
MHLGEDRAISRVHGESSIQVDLAYYQAKLQHLGKNIQA